MTIDPVETATDRSAAWQAAAAAAATNAATRVAPADAGAGTEADTETSQERADQEQSRRERAAHGLAVSTAEASDLVDTLGWQPNYFEKLTPVTTPHPEDVADRWLTS